MSFELSKSCLELKFLHITIATHDVIFMVGTACEFFRRDFGWKVFVICLLYRTFKEKLKIQGHHPFKLGLGLTTICIMLVYKKCYEIWCELKQEWGAK